MENNILPFNSADFEKEPSKEDIETSFTFYRTRLRESNTYIRKLENLLEWEYRRHTKAAFPHFTGHDIDLAWESYKKENKLNGGGKA